MDAREREARFQAARMMGLSNDGEHLPEELWSQMLDRDAAPVVTCPTCRGDGLHPLDDIHPFFWPSYRYVDDESGDERPCPDCGGTGWSHA